MCDNYTQNALDIKYCDYDVRQVFVKKKIKNKKKMNGLPIVNIANGKK